MSKEDNQQNITFSIDSDDSETAQRIGDGILSGIKKKIKNNTNIKQIKEEASKIGKQEQSWKQFVKARTQGKKFESRQAVNEYRKQLGKDYKAL